MPENNEQKETETQTQTIENNDNGQPKPESKADFTNIFSQGYKEGQAKQKERLKEIFGTDNFGDLKQFAEKMKEKPAEKQDPKIEETEAFQKVLNENKKLSDSLQQIETDKIISERRGKILNEVNRQGIKTQKFAKLITDDFFQEFEIKENGKIYKIGEEMPHVINNELATIEKIVEDYKTNEFKEAFKKSGGPGHINQMEGGRGGVTNYKVDPESDFFIPGFREALKRSGQLQNVYNNKPVDLTKLHTDYKTFGLNFS